MIVAHTHTPLLRVVPRQHVVDASNAEPSLSHPDNRWNTAAFPALYCCCSLVVAIAVARLKLSRSGVELTNLSPEARPAVSEIAWSGNVVDVASAGGVEEAGFPADYPATTTIAETQAAATRWHAEGREGVVCRSDALWRQGESAWSGSHEPWGEVAIFVRNAVIQPVQGRRYVNLSWLDGRLAE